MVVVPQHKVGRGCFVGGSHGSLLTNELRDLEIVGFLPGSSGEYALLSAACSAQILPCLP